jgi:hypothetical protein
MSREKRLMRRAFAFGKPDVQNLNGLPDEWRSAFLTALADAMYVRSSTKRDVSAGQAGSFGDPKTRLNCQNQQRMVSASGPGRPITGSQQRVHFLFGEERHQVALEPLRRDSQDALD